MKRNSSKALNVLRKSGKYCCINLHSDYAYVWTLDLTIAEDLKVRDHNYEHAINYSYVGDTLDEVIMAAYEWHMSRPS